MIRTTAWPLPVFPYPPILGDLCFDGDMRPFTRSCDQRKVVQSMGLLGEAGDLTAFGKDIVQLRKDTSMAVRVMPFILESVGRLQAMLSLHCKQISFVSTLSIFMSRYRSASDAIRVWELYIHVTYHHNLVPCRDPIQAFSDSIPDLAAFSTYCFSCSM